MADPQTANIQLFTPVNGADPGTWDVPVNANWNQLEALLGTTASVALSNLPITLSAGQYNTSLITFTGTLTANVTVTFPPFVRTWHLFNSCLGDPRSLTVVCKTSAAAATAFIALPPGQVIRVISDGANIRYMDLPPVTSYLDIGSSTVPAWITNATPQPYLNCDGTTFSSATFPALRDYLGSNVLPDSRGRFRNALDQTAGRITSASSLGGGGSQFITQSNIPSYGLTVTDPGHSHGFTPGSPVTFQSGIIALQSNGAGDTTVATVSEVAATTGITVNSAGSGSAYLPPQYTGGLTLIRAG